MAAHLRTWIEHWKGWAGDSLGFISVFAGGGTPGLFTHEWRQIMPLIQGRLTPGAEVSLEANPGNISAESLQVWKDVGFNRLSLGVQTFDAGGLQCLTRDHSAEEADVAIRLALLTFPNLNIDLIYGWPGQTEDLWRADLKRAVELGVPHLSLYNLTYESSTTMGRRAGRGLVERAAPEHEARLYEIACEVLADEGYDQEEVSNWSKPGYSCAHNWLYWRGEPFLGVGAGAHGFLPIGPWGLRYQYPKNDRAFVREGVPNILNLESHPGVIEIDNRDGEAWLLERIGSGLRTREGLPLDQLLDVSQHQWQPTGIVERGLREGLLTLHQGVLQLTPAEWFRETAWATAISCSLVPKTRR